MAAEGQFGADCAALTAAPHRLSGTAEYGAAADYVAKRLDALGAEVVVQEFPSAQVGEACTIEVANAGNARLETRNAKHLLAMRPNGIVPPGTPPGGLTGQLLHAGAGGLGDFGDRSPQGRIVVLDYNCGRSWLRAFRLGAKAVIFVPNGPARAWECHHTIANANLPRFYYAGPRADLPDGATATIRSQTPWRGATGRNVLAFFRGTSAKFDQNVDEMLIVAANLDTFGEVPRLSPGARGAANCAALLRLAEHLKANRPRRHVLLAFLDNQARGHAGAAALYRVLDQASDATIKLGNRAASLETEELFLADMRSLLAKPNPLTVDSPVRREMVLRLKRNAAAHSFELRQALYDLRKAQAARGADAALDAAIAAKEAEKDRWNALLRVLARGRDTQEAADILPAALAELRGETTSRSEELEAERRALLADKRLHELVGKLSVSLHVSLLLGDASPRWGLAIGGDSAIHIPGDDPGLYGKIQTVFLRAAESLDASPSPLRHFERASADGTLDPPRLLWAAPFLIHSGEVAGRLGIYNLALATAQESLPREGTPDDTLAALDLSRIEAQAAEACALIAAVASHQGLSLRRGIVPDAFYSFPEFPSDYHPRGPMAMGRLPGSPMPDRQMPHAILQLHIRKRGAAPWTDLTWQPKKPYAFDDFIVLRTNQNGSYGFGPVRKDTWNLAGFAARFDPCGQVSAASDVASAGGVATRLNMFPCRSGAAVLPPQLQPNPIQVLRARGNSPLDDDRSFTQTLDGVAYWYCETKEDTLKLFGLRALVGLGSGHASRVTRHDWEGDGFSTTPPWPLPSTAHLSARDLWRLNEARMQVLRSRGIVNSSLEQLHGEAEDLLLDAAKTPAVAEAEAIAASAFLAEQPVYELTRSTLNDLVRAVLVLLGLSVPFAFAAERLLVGATNVYRQIAWFAAFFTLTFLILFFTHPAFAISQTPTIIFLGFAVVVLAALVIVIIMRRFEVELKVLQGLTSTVHAADVSRFSTVMAAMAMGISTMRRRPLRTALTAITIVMLTFTILCFASFGTQTGIVKLFVGASPGYSGAFLHKVSWTELNPDILDVLGPRWGKAAVACNRLWISPKTPQNQGPLITRADGARPLALRGVLGLDAREFAHRPDLAALFGANADRWESIVLVTTAVADRLGVKPGDPVLVGGLPLTVGTLLDPSQVSAAKDMDGNGILPVDFVEMRTAVSETASGEAALTAQGEQNWAYLPTDSVVVVSAANARLMGATLHAVTLYTPDTRSATDLAEAVAKTFPLPVSATRSEGVYRHVLGTLVEASGAGDLVFPILLGGLVIFGTMLGSVADREKEIYTFSSLGLAPPHVASLFFAEALVYSVIGGMAGYLLAQGTNKLLSWLATYGLVRVPEMNYSSANAIATILIVMGTVLVSAIYPAIKASRSANPGILRSWRLPPPKGDVLDLEFPFTVSEYDITGVVSFLKEHFDNFGDTGLGRFMARNARLVRGEAKQLGLDADLALAPFDLGVTQAFELRSRPSEIPGIDVVAIRITRKSGQPKDWRRLNKALLDDLRRQFLIWRALPHETMELYRQRTLTQGDS
ncbi:MAG: FtsX-like permease family protein [Planctomycetes bacterium]|nr:FtsX-like permease family protein [Planctomycetota bacterium]